jgi:hypothetical protein
MAAHMASYTCFEGNHCIASGTLSEMALAVNKAQARQGSAAVLLFDNQTGKTVDLDLRGSDADIAARYHVPDRQDAPAEVVADTPKGRGRPKLGVVAREITLLPRHWEWLAAQPGGASVAVRKLVDAARKSLGHADAQRLATERTYQFMVTIAGDYAGFEAASRALFAGDRTAMAQTIAAWPEDVRTHIMALLVIHEADADRQ